MTDPQGFQYLKLALRAIGIWVRFHSPFGQALRTAP